MRAAGGGSASVDRVSELIVKIFINTGSSFAKLVEAFMRATSGEVTVDHLEELEVLLALVEEGDPHKARFQDTVLVEMFMAASGNMSLSSLKIVNRACERARELGVRVDYFCEYAITVAIKLTGSSDEEKLNRVIIKMGDSLEALREAGITGEELFSAFRFGIVEVTKLCSKRPSDEMFCIYEKVVEKAKALAQHEISDWEFEGLFLNGLASALEKFGDTTLDNLIRVCDKVLQIAVAARQAGIKDLEFSS